MDNEPTDQRRKPLTGCLRAVRATLLLFTLLTSVSGATELFMTHHAPMGAWSSLTFGLPGAGVGIEREALQIQPSGGLVVACSRGPGQTVAFPFFTSTASQDCEMRAVGATCSGAFRNWKLVQPGALARTLTPATDEYAGGGIRLRVTSPRMPLEPPFTGEALALATLPALLMEVEIDNSAHDVAATGFIGFTYQGNGRMRALDWNDGKLAGVAFQDCWALAALSSSDVFTIRGGSIAHLVEAGCGSIHPGGNEGGIGFRVAPHSKGKLVAVFAFYRAGNDVAQGMSTSYANTASYNSVEAVAHAALKAADQLRAGAKTFDKRVAPDGSDPLAVEWLAQASQGYYANSSLLRDSSGALHWSLCEGQYGWRNTLDLAADHLPFELTAHPWVAGNVIDGFIDRYSYRDQVRFEGETEAHHPGGLSFTHDQGNYTAYSPAGTSGYERAGRKGYSFMTTEQLLNGIYCSAAFALKGGDPEWRRRRLPVARELIASMENREGADPARRDGILRAQSDRVGDGNEITTYDALDPALRDSCGNLYVAVKTWCAAQMLERWFAMEGDAEGAARCSALAGRTARSLGDRFDLSKGAFPANLLESGDSLVLAALDPLAVPLFCGMDEDLRRYPELIGQLKTHAETCLQPGRCLDSKSGGLRLSSASANTWPSKVALVLASTGWLENRSPKETAPGAYARLGAWLQGAAKRVTVSDQIDASTGEVLGGSYYPRLVTIEALIKSGTSIKTAVSKK